MIDKLFGNGFFTETDPYADDDGGGGGEYSSRANGMEPDTDIPSHMTLDVDDTGSPVLARMTYVDEDTCIGCRNCALVARSTFFMEDSLAGKARVYNQVRALHSRLT